LQILAQSTQGIPRLLNRAMHKASSLARTGEVEVLDAEVILESVTVLGLAQDETGEFASDDARERIDPQRARDGGRGHRLFAGPRRIG
jgi:hypothetical protein